MVVPVLRSAALIVALVLAAMPVCTGWASSSTPAHACCAAAEAPCAERLVDACCASGGTQHHGEIAPGTLLLTPVAIRASAFAAPRPAALTRVPDASLVAARTDTYLLFSVLLV